MTALIRRQSRVHKYRINDFIQLLIFMVSAKSPVFSHIAETLNGLSTIRAHGAEELLRKEFDNHQDLNTGVYFMFLGVYSKTQFNILR